MINFTIHHKKEPLNKVLAVELPMNADNLSDLLQELGYEPPEKLKVNSNGKPYVIELNSDTNMGFAILERLCDNDTIAELNNLCTVICKCSDQDYIYQTIFNSDVRCINGIKKLFADRFMEFSDKLVLNTSLKRKPTELAVKGCIIEKAIPVRHRKFEAITKYPLRDEPLIAENKDIMYFDSKYNMYHCLLIYDRDFGDGIVVESEGSNYARYAQYVPQAKVIYEQHRSNHINELRLCCPIEIYQHIYDYPKDNCILDNADMAGYADDINAFIYENDLPAEHEIGLMHWYHPEGPDDEIAEKVYSVHCMNITVVIISSLNRESYANGIKAVTESSFKQSGAIEYSTDVLIAYEYSLVGNGFDCDRRVEEQKDPRETRMVILKNRNGKRGGVIQFYYYPLSNYIVEAENNNDALPNKSSSKRLAF